MMFRRRRREETHNEGFWRYQKPLMRGHTLDIKFPISPNVTEPLHIAGVVELPGMTSIDKTLWESLLPGIQDVKFGPLNVTEVTYGYFLKAKYNAEGVKHWDDRRRKYFGREIPTEGFAIYFKDDIFKLAFEVGQKKGYDDYALDNENDINKNSVRQVVAHTFKHALLSRLPYLIGLEPSKISGSYDFVDMQDSQFNAGAKNVVYIYDAETGGTGACKTIFKDAQLFLRWLDGARYVIKNCPAGSCKKGHCLRCVYIENCGEINLNLNRYLAAAIFFEKDSLDWVFE